MEYTVYVQFCDQLISNRALMWLLVVITKTSPILLMNYISTDIVNMTHLIRFISYGPLMLTWRC